MPATNGQLWRDCREDMDITSDEAASLLGITGGALRQIELELKPASGRLAAKAARLYRVPKQSLFRSAEDPKGKPVRPEPKVEPVAPRPRPDRESRKTGPKRAQSRSAA